MKYLLLVATIPLLLGCSAKKQVPVKLAPVYVARAEAESVPYVIRTIGNAVEVTQVKVVPQVTGQLMEYFFEEGDYVDEGQLLCTIDPSPFEAAVEQTKGQLDQAYAQLAFAKEKVRRYDELLPEDYVALLDYDQYVSDVQMTQGMVEEYEGAVRKAQIDLSFCTIRSPRRARTGRQIIDSGNIVSAEEQNPLFILNQISPMHVQFSIPERYFFEIQEARKSNELDVVASFIGGGSREWVGKLFFVNNEVDSSSGTIRCMSIYENDDCSLWPGLFVDVTLVLYVIPDAVIVPSEAVQVNSKGKFVFVLDEKADTVAVRQVTPGQRFHDRLVIQNGLEKGEVVVTQGQLGLAPGKKVEIKGWR